MPLYFLIPFLFNIVFINVYSLLIFFIIYATIVKNKFHQNKYALFCIIVSKKILWKG
ncbi:hypothetical protein FDC06_14290 [Clostridium botulinum]|uniref:Uncharacterized protein n=1 Tax=Clostridium botulinum (strain Hall / ATCC 3502 / NCTC 13319 / Type A) TaxID=441771 RepID=A5I207_CLOBH|nr:hypothetical protein DB732_08405 [Clostridium botulinum]CAL83071.1 hypothetical protein CBO1530 [Clostridium botulinum A str. ATCC 3502]AWB30277.1 hypothetical protein DBN47_08375 [Clostridium botulinum]EGT5615805.1 hypothetical protein [Clostridium botulinum]EGT5622687.1 hypothetical protein [Clostridium botulinum]